MSELITYKLSLNTEYKGCEKQINLIQGESEARAIDVTLTNGSGRIILDSVTDIAIVRGIRSDGKITYNSAKVNSNGNAEYVFTQQDCAKSGTGYYELQILRLKDSNNTDLIKVMYSAQFKIKVDETLYNDEQITSVNEYTELITALAEVKVLQNSLDETIEEAQASLDEAVRSAQNSLKEAIEDAQSSVNDVIYIEDGANIQWTAQSESMAVSSVIESDRVRLLNDGGSTYRIANLCNVAETQNIVIEPMGGVPIQGHSIVSISNDTPIYMALKDENGVGTYELHSGITTFAIQSGSSVAIYNDSDENIEISYTLLDVAKSVTLPEDYFIPDEYKLVIFAQGIMGIQVAAEDIEAVTYQTVKNYYMREQDELNKRFETLELIVEGRTTGYVFDTETDMNTWLEDAENLSRLKMGDNLYIRALDVPDYWWDGTTAQPLETQKVDLSEYYTKKQVDTYFVPSTRTVAGIGLYSNIMPSTLAQVISLEMASAIAGNSSGINIIAYGLSGYTSAFAAQIASNMSFCNTFGNMLGMAFGSNTQYVAAASNIAKSSAFGDAFGSYLASYIASNSAYSLALSYIGNHSWFFEALKKTLTEKSYVLVPKPNSADAGKILTITSTGGLSWITP